LRRRS